MKICQIVPYKNLDNKISRQENAQRRYGYSTKSTAIITVSLLSLATIAKSEIDYTGIYKNKVDQTFYQRANNTPIIDMVSITSTSVKAFFI